MATNFTILEELRSLKDRLESLEDTLGNIEENSLLASKNVLTFEDACKLTGLSKSYLYKLTCTHQIPYYKGNGVKNYFVRKELEKWMTQARVQTTTEAEKKAVNYVVTNDKED